MTLHVDVQSLRQVPMFRDVDPARLRLLAFGSERLSYDEGAVLFHQDEISDATYLIVEGEIEVWVARDGHRAKIADLGAGALVGEMGVLCDRPRSATVKARTFVVALRIGREMFFDMLRQFPQMSLAVMRELARRGSEATARRELDEGAMVARVAQ
jgi:CRP-like cAMP-binding protein